MTEQEFYVWLLNSKIAYDILPEFKSDFLKNYEIAKLVLDKFGINSLSKEQQRILNPEAVSNWFRVSEYVKLEYDIPEILELLPERIRFSLDLQNSEIQSLPELKTIGGWLILRGSQIKSLPQLESVGNDLDLSDSEIKSLPKLKSVEGDLDLAYSKIESLPKLESVGYLNLNYSQIESLPQLEYVGDTIYASYIDVDYWRNYFRETRRPHLANKILE